MRLDFFVKSPSVRAICRWESLDYEADATDNTCRWCRMHQLYNQQRSSRYRDYRL